MNHPTRMAPPASLFLFASATLMLTASHAHHSSAMYDDKQTITVEGTVARFEWSNPHVYIYVKQMTTGGQAVEWEIEAGPPSIMGRIGWSRDTLHVGDAITVIGSPSRDASKRS